jgi:predicted N-acetyltransferase YhbS
MTSDYEIRPERAVDAPLIEPLLDRAFGPDRTAKTTYRLREGVAPVAGLSFVAVEAATLLGTLRFWPVRLPRTDGTPLDVLLLGPIAIEPIHKDRGIGRALMRHGLAAAAARGWPAVLLVGDPEYYTQFGFMRSVVVGLTLPGPVEDRRFLGLELIPGALRGCAGEVARAL